MPTRLHSSVSLLFLGGVLPFCFSAAHAKAHDDDVLLNDAPAFADISRSDMQRTVPTLSFQDRRKEDVPMAPVAIADEGDGDRKWADDYLGVAVGVVALPSYNGADETTVMPGFAVRGRVSGFSFSTRGAVLQADLLRENRDARTDFSLGPAVGVRSDRGGKIKDVQVRALGKRQTAVELGMAAGVTRTGVITSDYDQLSASVTGLYDVTGGHGSWVISPSLDYGTPLSTRIFVGLSASLNIYGKGFGRYYFDVDPAGSAASGLPVYSAAGSKATAGKYTLGAIGIYSLSGDLRKGLSLMGGVQYGRLTGRYGRSPVVAQAGDADQWTGGVGIAYQF